MPKFSSGAYLKDLSFKSWRYYNQIKKKATDNEPSASGLILSLSVAFFIVTGSAAGLNSIYNVTHNHLKTKNQVEIRETKRWENVNQFLASLTEVNAVLAAETDSRGQTEKYTHYISSKQEQVFAYTLNIKNVGKDTWKKGEVFLETGASLKRFSIFQHSSWINHYRLAGLSGDIGPGKTAQFKFSMKSPAAIGQYQEDLQLVKNNFPIAGTLTRVFIDVAALKNYSSAPAPTPAPVLSPVVISAPVTPFSASIPNASSLNSTSGSKDFCIALTEVEKKQYEQCNTNPNENNQGNGIVNYGNFLTVEPTIRVGLFNTTSTERVSCNVLYDIYSGSDLIYSGLDPSAVPIISYNPSAAQYVINLNGSLKTVANPVRVVTRGVGGLVTLPDYDQRPAWNKTLNDNIFRNIIEFNYSNKTKKFWIINELPIESYLKGLAETSNISHAEFQKTLITAARTYALYHYFRGVAYGVADGSTKHASEHFHVDATYDQVYRGYGSEIRMPNLVQAVDATRGAIVTYSNEIAITPYFSRSDGRTRSWTEVWGGSGMPWLVSVAVPDDKGQTLWGHGVGLSARGALLMANAGQLWSDILKYFYQGTDLRKVYN